MRITTDPTRELSLLQGDVNRVFERFFGPAAGASGQGQGTSRWLPPLDIVEEDDRFVLHLDLPGMREEDISIELEDRVLRVSGERRDERERSGDGFRRLERSFGSFERMLTLPQGVDPEVVQASFDRGVLEIVVPKPVETRPRRIDIKVGSGESGRPDQIEGAGTSDPGQSESKRSLKDRVLSNA